ncbi:MAG: Transcriptional regulatory protein QseB [Pseudomonadota bacterium]|jgi:two-component system OmpR family response regulator/two-component system response regulator QseB
MRVLLAEDDETLGSGLKAGLAQNGFQVDWVRDGIAAEREMLTQAHEVVILDMGLPRQDGLISLKKIRQKKIQTPVIILTAQDAVSYRIEGLDAGADDYLVKPVDLLELAARLRALVRRSHGEIQSTVTVKQVTLNSTARVVTLKSVPVDLSTREFDLLFTFMMHAGHVLTRDQLEKHLYSWGTEVSSNTVEVHIYHLRRKLGNDVIQTVRGVGYVMPK